MHSYRFAHLCLVAVAHLVVTEAFADSVESRASRDGQAADALAELTAPARQIISEIDARLQQTGKMPSYSQFLEALASAKELSPSDRLNLFTLFGRVQKPSLTGAELHDLLRAQQASLPILHVVYEVEHPVSAPVDGRQETRDVVESCSFAMQYPKLMFDKAITIGGGFKDRTLEAYDGTVIRGKITRPDSMEFVTVQQLDSRSRFFEETNPLLAAMFVNCSQESELMFKEQCDAALLTQRTFVYESQETVSDHPCIVVGNEQLQAFFAPELSYAVVEMRSGGIQVTPSGGYVKSPSHSTVTNSDFARVSDGVWLPMRSEAISIRQNKVYSHSITKVRSYDTSPKDPDKLFDGDIPDGAYVADVVNNVSYLAGSDDIAKRLSTGVRERDGGSFRHWWLVLANGVAVFALVSVMAYRRWSRKR